MKEEPWSIYCKKDKTYVTVKEIEIKTISKTVNNAKEIFEKEKDIEKKIGSKPPQFVIKTKGTLKIENSKATIE
ncbi:MAG: hypothetical protein EKK64_08585 [Neisseriaceae bacterium]|nr:MAG: hypothetical protein EKK64_08585 [Neisseriaceae bacterium]